MKVQTGFRELVGDPKALAASGGVMTDATEHDHMDPVNDDCPCFGNGFRLGRLAARTELLEEIQTLAPDLVFTNPDTGGLSLRGDATVN